MTALLPRLRLPAAFSPVSAPAPSLPTAPPSGFRLPRRARARRDGESRARRRTYEQGRRTMAVRISFEERGERPASLSRRGRAVTRACSASGETALTAPTRPCDTIKRQSARAPERQSARAPERQSARAPERQSARAPERQSARAPERQSARAPERQSASQSARAPERQSARAPERQSARAPERQSARAPERQSARAPERQSARAPERQSARAPERQSCARSAPDGRSVVTAPFASHGPSSSPSERRPGGPGAVLPRFISRFRPLDLARLAPLAACLLGKDVRAAACDSPCPRRLPLRRRHVPVRSVPQPG